MIYVQRNEDGVIVGVFASEQPGLADEPLKADDQEVLEFYNRGAQDV